MDKETLQSLRLAYGQSPDNTALRMVLVRGLFENGEAQEALALLDGSDAQQLEAADCLLAARVLLAAEDAERALGFLAAADCGAEGLLLRARACLALHDHEAGLAAYREAVAQNASLEDPDLEKSLSARVTPAKTDDDGKVVGFRVISNEDKVPVAAAGDGDENDAPPPIEPSRASIRFSDVGGLEEVKKIIHRKIILPFQKPAIFAKFRRKAGGGVLMYGPPGCGKTLLAQATAGECGAKFYNVAISDILDMWLGNSEKKLHAIFEQARRTAPAVLFFDELEGLAGKRQYENSSAAVSKTISQFLSEMDGFAKNNTGVLVIGATNVPWSVDAAFRRPGRFDRVLFIPPPDREARAAIFKIHMEGRPAAGDIDFDALARGSSGFSGADIENVVETACDIAIEESLSGGHEVPVGMAQMKAALKEARQTTGEWLSTARNYARYSNEGGQYDEVIAFLQKHGE
ncbi:MAG: AAA family ATPase [Alphaproteobacteria bacterium]|nr:AAA family ATPase [Alphaproteobacteria bacterium]